MGRRRRGDVPPYLLHKSSGQAYSTWGGETAYHGRHGSPESRRAYQEFLARWEAAQAAGGVPAVPEGSWTVRELCLAFLEEARLHYRHEDGTPTGTYEAFARVARGLVGLHGGLGAADYRARHLRELRDGWVAAGFARVTVNKYAGQARHIFRWGVARDDRLVPAEVLVSLGALPGLREGRTEAPERPPVPPAPEQSVWAALPFLPRQLRAIVLVQWHAGPRPGEVCRMKGSEVHRDGRARLGRHAVHVATGGWVFQPSRHKTRHANKFVAYVLGPKARAVLEPWLRADPEEYLFSPREAEAERLAARRAAADAPGRKRRRGKGGPARVPGPCYRESSYGGALRKACARAGAEPFAPHQLRHAFLTRVEADCGMEDARKAVCHSSLEATAVYVASDLRRAAEIAELLG
jgi:integrase